MKYCGKCGAQLPDDAVFCDNCGNSFIEKTADNSSNKTSAPVTAIKINKKKAFILFGFQQRGESISDFGKRGQICETLVYP